MAGRNFVQIKTSVLEPRLPELGQIKIGGKGEKRGGYRLPVKYDHFVVTKRERDKDSENLVRDNAIHRLVGARPKELDVRLLFDRPEQNFQYFLGAYDGRRPRCRGNGEVAHDREHGEVPCTCPWLKQHDGLYSGPDRPLTGDGALSCKPHGRLSVILEAAAAFGGFFLFRTTSWETISSIAAQLDTYLAQFGFLAGLPLKLVMYPTTDTYEDERGKSRSSTSYKVALVVRGSFDTARQLASAAYERREQLALPSSRQAELHQQQMLQSEERDAEEISAEFHPESSGDGDGPGPEEWYEVVEDEEGEEELAAKEDLIRTTLEFCDWKPERINKFVAGHSDDFDTAIKELEQRVPNAVEKARERIGEAAPSRAEGGPEEEGVSDDQEKDEIGDNAATEEEKMEQPTDAAAVSKNEELF